MKYSSLNSWHLSSEFLKVAHELAGHPEGLELAKQMVELAKWTHKLHSASAPCGQENLLDEITRMDKSIQQTRDRLNDVEYGLHAENGRLRDENLGLRQEVDYSSEDYCSNEDSLERQYSASRTGGY